MPITSVDGDNIVRCDQTGVIIAGSGFGASQGSGTVTLRYGTRSVALPVTAWGDTSITVNMALGNTPFGAGPFVRVVTNGGTTMDGAVNLLPPSGHSFQFLSSINESEAARLVGLPDLAIGCMVWYCGVGQVAVPTGLNVNPDGSHYWSVGSSEQPWLARLWDVADESYQPSFALQYYTLTPPAPSPGGGGSGIVVPSGRPLRSVGPRMNWRR